ncbi:MAG: antibiotic biosynthesis monooxygenase [Bacteroidota bacterium]
MLTRFVKLTFKTENIASFEQIFDETHTKIRGFKGCTFLELFQDTNTPEVFFTLSKWENETCLEAYRNSDLFKSTWKRTKALFAEKPEAWSLTKKVGQTKSK